MACRYLFFFDVAMVNAVFNASASFARAVTKSKLAVSSCEKVQLLGLDIGF
jgi:hypothetical protein